MIQAQGVCTRGSADNLVYRLSVEKVETFTESQEESETKRAECVLAVSGEQTSQAYRL